MPGLYALKQEVLSAPNELCTLDGGEFNIPHGDGANSGGQ